MLTLMLGVGLALGATLTYSLLLRSFNAAEDELKEVKQEGHQAIMEARVKAQAKEDQVLDLKADIKELKKVISEKDREYKSSQKKWQDEALALGKRIVELETRLEMFRGQPAKNNVLQFKKPKFDKDTMSLIETAPVKDVA